MVVTYPQAYSKGPPPTREQLMQAHAQAEKAKAQKREFHWQTIMKHLFTVNYDGHYPIAPAEVTQDTIAEAAGITRGHASQVLASLLDQGMIGERTTHVVGRPRRVKAYFLTPQGYIVAQSLKEKEFTPGKALTIMAAVVGLLAATYTVITIDTQKKEIDQILGRLPNGSSLR